MWFFIRDVKYKITNQIDAHDNEINAKITTEIDRINKHFTTEIVKINARDANYVTGAQRIMASLNTITMKLNETEQILEQHQSNFGRIHSEFVSINTTIATIQNVINQHTISQRIEQDRQSFF
jgi:hypothetical protein